MHIPIKWTLVGGFLGLQAIPVAVIIASSFFTSQRVLLQHADDIMTNIATYTIQQAQSYLEPARDAARLTQRLADSEVVGRKNLASLEQYFYEQLGLHANFAGIYLGSANGDFLYVSRMDEKVPGGFRTKTIEIDGERRTTELIFKDSALRQMERQFDPEDRYDPRKRPWYQAAVARRETIWSEPYIFYTSRKPGLTAASPVFGADGAVTGVVGVDIEIDAISQFLRRLKVGKHGRAFILNNNGDVIAFPEPDRIRRPAEAADGSYRLTKIGELDHEPSRRAFESLHLPAESFLVEHPVFGSFELQGQTYHTMFAPFPDSHWPWVIGIYLPEDDYLGPIKTNRLTNGYIMLLVAGLASLVGLLIARSIVRPMTAFRAEARAVQEGDLDTVFDKSSTVKEIEETATSFARMKQGLREQSAELRSKETQLRATFTSLLNFSDALLVLSNQGAVRFANPAAERLLGVSRRELSERDLPFLPKTAGITEFDLGNGSGAPLRVEARASDTEWEGEPGLLVALRDVTEQRHLAEQLQVRAETLGALHETALELGAQKELPQLLRAIAERATHLLQAKDATIFLYRPEEDALQPVLWGGQHQLPGEARVHRGEGLVGRVLAERAPRIVNDYPAWEGRLLDWQITGYPVCAAVPILWGERPLGVLIVGHEPPNRFHLADLDLLEQFTPLAAAALEQHRLLREAGELYVKAQRDAETKSILLQEVNHRVKNNLSAVIGMLYAEKRYTAARRDPAYQEAMQGLIHRMQGLAAVHSLLSAREWRPVPIRELVDRVVQAVVQTLPAGRHVEVEISPDPSEVPATKASSLAMVVNEIATNTVKHGLAGADGGSLAVRILPDPETNRVVIEFHDDGAGYPPQVLDGSTFNTGLYLIRSIITRDLEGELTLTNDGGAMTCVRLSLDREPENDHG